MTYFFQFHNFLLRITLCPFKLTSDQLVLETSTLLLLFSLSYFKYKEAHVQCLFFSHTSMYCFHLTPLFINIFYIWSNSYRWIFTKWALNWMFYIMWKSSLRKIFGHNHDLTDQYLPTIVSSWKYYTVYITSDQPSDWLTMSFVMQRLLTLPEHPTLQSFWKKF